MKIVSRHFDPATVTAGGQPFTVPANPKRVKLWVWNNSAYNARFKFGPSVLPTGSKGGIIYRFGGDEFLSQEKLQVVPDATAGANGIEISAYEEYVE